jgi:hypothetical protein
MCGNDNLGIKNNYHFNNYRKNYNQDYDHHHSYVYNPPSKINYAGYILKKIWSDRKLRILLFVSLVVIKAVIVLLILLVIPVIGDLSDYIKQEGLQGIIGTVAGLIDKLWNGA